MITANTRCCLQDRKVKCSWYSPLWSQKPQTRNLWVIRTRGTVSSPTQRISLQTIWLGQSCTTLNTVNSLIFFSSEIGISLILVKFDYDWLIIVECKKIILNEIFLFLSSSVSLIPWQAPILVTCRQSSSYENLQVVLTLIWRTGDKRCRDVFWPVSLLTGVILVLQ